MRENRTVTQLRDLGIEQFTGSPEAQSLQERNLQIEFFDPHAQVQYFAFALL
jgi:hypothetical protein